MPNPIRKKGPYVDILIGGRPLPGKLIRGGVKGLKTTEEWAIVRPIAGTGWAQNHKGRKPIEGIELVCSLNARNDEEIAAAWDAHYAYVEYTRGALPPKPSRPKAMVATGAMFFGAGVKAVVYAGHIEPLFDNDAYLVTYIFNEHSKSTPFPVGPPEAAILNDSNPVPKTQGEIALVAAVGAVTGAPVPFSTISERYPGVGATGAPP